MSQLEQLKASVDALPRPEQAALASYLLDKLGPDPAPDQSDEEYWSDVSQRIADIRAGKVEGQLASEVIAEFRAKYS